MHRFAHLLLAGCMALAACTSGGADDATTSHGGVAANDTDRDDQAQPTTTLAPTTTEPPCRNETRTGDEVMLPSLPSDPVQATVAVSAALFPCADEVGIVPVNGSARQDAKSWAAAERRPLLVVDDSPEELRSEVDRLGAEQIVWLGGPDTVAEIEAALELPVVLAGPIDELGVVGGSEPERVAVFAEEEQIIAELLGPTLDLAGIAVAVGPPATDPATLADLSGAEFIFSDAVDPTTRWRWELARAGTELPGGGTNVFPDRRMVGFYGSPVTFRLGLLGESGPERAVERVQAMVDSYQLEGTPPVIGMFEIIATVADVKAGDDGDYSNELAPADMREWVEIATANDLFVIIDLQPGRTDFLTQAKRYEEFLIQPNVGLALDPEWRLEPDEVHLTQIGNVDAAEINTVVDYLTELVREHALPQKVLVLHQFQIQMLPDRELVRTPPELAVVVHVDGQGPLFSKYGTYDQMIEHPSPPEQTLWWGWKNFIDEDFPTATPAQTNAVEPLPMVVTFQ